MFMKKLKKYYKWIILVVVIITIVVLSALICKNLFNNEVSNRLDGVEDHEITKNEINLVKETLDKIEVIENINISTNYKLIKIFIELKEDVELKDIDEIATESLSGFSEENLKFYDVEIFVECLNEESEIYPKIGYKHKSNSEFTWNR